MDNQPARDQPSTNPQSQSNSQAPPEAAIARAETAKHSERKAEADQGAHELRREFRWFEMASLAVNAILAGIGIGALCIYSGQLKVMQGQLDQMKGGSAQTDRLIANAERLSQSAENSLAATKSIISATLAPTFRFSPITSPPNVRIHFVNLGRSAATNIAGSAMVTVKMITSGQVIYSNKIQFKETSVRPDAFLERTVAFDVPPYEDLVEKDIVLVEARLSYDDGFGNRPTFEVCRGEVYRRGLGVDGLPLKGAYSGSGGDCDSMRSDPRYRAIFPANH